MFSTQHAYTALGLYVVPLELGCTGNPSLIQALHMNCAGAGVVWSGVGWGPDVSTNKVWQCFASLH
jgi:hypothetical protein